MTPHTFRTYALALPGCEEGEHMGHPDFRVSGRIFATLTADGKRGMVKVSASDQRVLVRSDPVSFEPAAGRWGELGCTMVTLATADAATLRDALRDAHLLAMSTRRNKS